MEQWRKLLTTDPRLSKEEATSGPTNEECYAALAAMGDDIIAVFETSKGCMYLSPNWERITGRSTASCTGADFYACLHPEHSKPFVTALQQAVCEDRAQLSLYPQQFMVVHADGKLRWYALKPGEVHTLPSGHQRIVCVLKDVHESLEAQRLVREAQREAQVALQARSEFLNSMSHELRTPLNAILGFTQIMENGMYGNIDNPQYRDYLRHIRESGYELLAQIDEVMEMATIDAGSPMLRRDLCELPELMQQVLSLHRTQIKAANISTQCETSPGLSRIEVDRTRLQHCISHIVANALRFSRPGGKISISAALNDNRELCITVADNGVGMSARKLHALVSALQQEDSWSSRNTNGLGLGLAMAKEYAFMHGGYITLESKAGLGTRVNIHLPAECVVGKSEKVLHYTAHPQ